MNYEEFIRKDIDFLARMFIDTDRGIILTMRALAICSKIMLEDEFMGDPDIYKDREGMLEILDALHRCYEIMYDNKKYKKSEEPAIETLNQIFPDIEWNL